MGAFEVANKLGILQAGSNPEWYRQSIAGILLTNEDSETAELIDDVVIGQPSTSGQGVSISPSLATLVCVQLRQVPAYRTCDITVDTLDTGATYTITINGSNITAATPTDEEDLLTDLKAAILADSVVGQAAATPIINAALYDSDGISIDTSGNPAALLRITGEASDDYTIDVSATGTGVLACVADLMQCNARVWSLFTGVVDSKIPTTWSLVKDADYEISSNGISERLETGGIQRIFVELYNPVAGGDGADITYMPKLYIGPSVLPSGVS